MRKPIAIVTLLISTIAAALVGLVGLDAKLAVAADPVAEAQFVGLINATRAAVGQPALPVHPVLTAKAQGWAAQLAADGYLHHSNLPDGVSVGWTRLGENIGYGGSVSSIHGALVASPPHYANMVDGGFNSVGVGVAYGSGRMWVVEEFMTGDLPPAGYGNPIGNLESAVRLPGSLQVSGWAIDPDTTAPITVHAYVDGGWGGAFTASANRPDVGATYWWLGSGHGFSFSLGAGFGTHQVCVYAINVGTGQENPLLGCVSPLGTPVGNFESATRSPGSVRLTGWAIDPDTANPIAVHVYVDGGWGGAYSASANRPDVGAAFAGYGAAHGFDVTVPFSAGTHRICVYAINVGPAAPNPPLGCTTV